MDRSDHGFHTLAPPHHHQIPFLVPSPLSIYLLLVPTLISQPDWRVPQTSGWKPPPLYHFSARQTVAICVIEGPALPISQPHLPRHPRRFALLLSVVNGLLWSASDCIISNHPFFSHSIGTLSAHGVSSDNESSVH